MKWKLIFTGLIVSLGITLLFFLNNLNSTELPPQETLGIPVQLDQVVEGNIRAENNYVGTVKSKNQMFLTFKQAGFITKVYVQEGDSFQKGDPLAQLDADEILLKKELAQQKKENAKLNSEHLQDLLEKNIILYEAGAVTKQEINDLTLKYDLALNTLKEAELSIKELELMLDRTNIYAPYDGVVRNVLKKEGEFTQIGQPVLEVSAKDDLILEVAVIEKDLQEIAIGDKAMVHIGDDYILESEITAIANTLNPQTKTANIEIPLEATTNLLPNMSLKASIIKEEKEKALLIPARAVIEKNKKYYIYSYENGIAKEKEIKLGINDGNMVEVIEGLELGEQIIISNLQELNNNSKVFVYKGVE